MNFTKLVVSFAMVSLSALSGCSSTFQLTPASNVAFVQGEVDPSFEDNGNGSIDVSVKHLGDPAKLVPGATTYVVWVQPKKEGAAIQNVGALKVSDDQEGELTFTTTFRSFTIMITPEKASDVAKPEHDAVLKGDISG